VPELLKDDDANGSKFVRRFTVFSTLTLDNVGWEGNIIISNLKVKACITHKIIKKNGDKLFIFASGTVKIYFTGFTLIINLCICVCVCVCVF